MICNDNRNKIRKINYLYINIEYFINWFLMQIWALYCALYCPFSFFFLLVELINFCWNMDLGIVIGCDVNVHHTSLGNSDINKRSNNLAELLMKNQISCVAWPILSIIIHVTTRTIVLDLTLRKDKIVYRIQGLQVSWFPSLSDLFFSDFD